MIVATAGHVDHGKTALVKALTGTDTDRLPEEKTRGLSIDLGFAYQTFPDNTTLGFVDVPGHEKFIRNLLAGVGGIDLGLLVVAADDGVMPQTREHAAILDLLGIDRRIVAITKIDRVDRARVLDVRDQVEALLGEAGDGGPAVYPVCAPENEGIDALRDGLRAQARETSVRLVDRLFRMAIDRAFTLKGVGLVVTGMVLAGEAAVGDSLLVSSDGVKVRVRGLRVHDAVGDRARAGERCAINIVGRGVGEGSVRRGHWLTHPDLYAPTGRIDVDLQVLASEPRPLKHWTPTHLHIGTDRIPARVAVLSGGSIAAGGTGLAQLVLARDALAVHGDRFVLRDPAAQRTIAGGRVIDPFSPRRGRARPARIAALRARLHRDPVDVLGALAEIADAGVPLAPFAISHCLPEPRVDALVDSIALRRAGRRPHERVFSAAHWQELLTRVETAAEAFHQSRPALAGPGLGDIRSALRPRTDTPVLEEALDELVNGRRLVRQGARFHSPSHVVRIPEHERRLWARAGACLAPPSGAPPSLLAAAEQLGIDPGQLEASLKNAVRAGEMVLVARNRYVPISYVARLGAVAEVLADDSDDGVFSVTEFRNRTRMGRNFIIDLLEYFDRIGFTVRAGNHRRIQRPASAAFPGQGARSEGRASHPGGAPGFQIQ